MFKTLRKSLEIDLTYSINSFIYILRKLPIFKDLITTDIYGSTTLKKGIRVIVALWLFIKVLLIKFFYFFIIFSLSYYNELGFMVNAYFHLYFVLTLLGIFINNKLLNTSKKKYFSLILFKMDADTYFKSNLVWNQLTNLVLNSICIFFFGSLIQCPIIYSIMLILLSFFARPIGEYGNILFFRKKHYMWYSNEKLYYGIVLFFVALSSLVIIDIYIPFSLIEIGTGVITGLGIIAFIQLWKIHDYKQMYLKLMQMTDVMNSKNDKDYMRQAMVAVKEKDKQIDSKKLEGKKGYNFFNTIFYERHKEILIRSAKKYSMILVGIYIVAMILVLTQESYKQSIGSFLNTKLGIFVMIMYFVNRGAIITQAMFFNCDHAMLNYNFYRQPETIIGLFKIRLKMLIKVNFLPATIIGIGNTILLVLTGNTKFITIITTFLFILFLSIFFSIHYLMIYYLLQPFNKNLEVKKASYSFATLATYILSYQMIDVVMDSLKLSIIGLTATILYSMIALFLVNRYAPKTFKLN